MIICMMKKITGVVADFCWSITWIMISFQFSPVRTMKIVIKDWTVEEKLYLEASPSSSRRGPLKNCFANRAEINKNSIVSTPRLVIAERDSSTVASSFLSDIQLLIILKTLINLNALSTDSPELSAYENSSIKLTTTMTPSNTLKPSLTYFLMPSPNSLSTISPVKITVKNRLAISPMLFSCSD